MHSDYEKAYNGNDADNPFASAALFMGILAILTSCTVIISIIFGSLGILFAILTKRRKKSLPSHAYVGVITSAVGTCLSLALLVASLIQLPSNLKNPEFRKDLNDAYEYLSGITFDEMLEQSGIDLDALLEKH